MRSILLQAGALTEFSLLASELKSLASAARGSELSTVVLEGGTKAFQKLSKEELADFMAFAARAKILQTEKGVEALSVAQRRSLLAFDRLAQDASQASVATSAAALAKPAAKVVEPNAARPSEPVSMSDKVAPPTEPGATPRSATEPRPAAEPTGPVASGPKPTPEPVRPGVEPPRAAGEPPGPIASGPKPAAEPDAPTVVVQPRVDPDAPTAVGPAPQPRSAPPVAGPTVPSPPIRAPPAGAPGSLENPLRGDDIVKQAFQLAGRTIRLPLGEPITVGNPVGSGGFNIVYEIKGQPDRLLKILKNPDPNISPASVLRQVNGYDLIKGDPTIPSAKIYSSGASRGGTSYLVVEDLNYGAWAQKNVKINVVSPNQAQLAAVEELYQNLGRRGLIWPDGKLDNIFFFEEAGKIRAGILDHDFIFRTKGLSEADIELMAWTFRGKPGSGAAVIDALGSPTWDASRFNDIMFKGLYKPPQ